MRLNSCPSCGHNTVKVIYAGIPARFCLNPDCCTIFGLGSNIITLLPFNGYLFVYHGSYIKGLWNWLFHREENE